MSPKVYGVVLGLGMIQAHPCIAASPPAAFETLYTFAGNADGGYPQQLQYLDGAIYGTASSGGENGRGVIYKVDPATGAETVLYNFTQAEGTVYGLNTLGGTVIYAQTYYYIVSYDIKTGVEKRIYDNVDNFDDTYSFLFADGALYGAGGGSGGLYRIDPKSGAYTVVYTFMSGHVAIPSNLINYRHKIYGTIDFEACANPKDGGVFDFDPSSGAGEVVCAFKNVGQPLSMVAAGNIFYGSLVERSHHRTITSRLFQYDPATRKEKTIFLFPGGIDGTSLIGQVTFANGILYGTTSDGGTEGCGDLFSFDTSSATYSVVYSFPCNADGYSFMSFGLIEKEGIIYGTTATGGTTPAGTVFSFTP